MTKRELKNRYGIQPSSESEALVDALIMGGLITVDPDPLPKSEEEQIAERMVQLRDMGVLVVSESGHESGTPDKFGYPFCIRILTRWLTDLKARWMAEGAELERERCFKIATEHQEKSTAAGVIAARIDAGDPI
jgi:hypothetical protein